MSANQTAAMSLHTILKSLLACLAIVSLTGCSISRVVRVEDRQVIDVKVMMAELQGARLIFAGERHNAYAHHRLQLDIIRELQRSGKRVAIGMEMFEDSSQKALDAWSSGKAPEFAIRAIYDANWRNIGWSFYSDIILFARDNRIPIVGLNPPRELVQKVAKQGLGSLTEAELRRLPEGVNAPATDSFINLIAASYPSHGKKGSAFRNLCEAQLLRNRVMAHRIAAYLEQNPERVMVVLAGGGHARKSGGIPEELRNLPYKVLLPPITTIDLETATASDADYLLVEPLGWLPEVF